jgi:hypothetical protein
MREIAEIAGIHGTAGTGRRHQIKDQAWAAN